MITNSPSGRVRGMFPSWVCRSQSEKVKQLFVLAEHCGSSVPSWTPLILFLYLN